MSHVYPPEKFEASSSIAVLRLEKLNDPEEASLELLNDSHYKIVLLQKLQGAVLLFLGPLVTTSAGKFTESEQGFLCLFPTSFFSSTVLHTWRTLSLYTLANKIHLDEEESRKAQEIFSRMHSEIGSDYPYKHDLLRNYISELTHMALKSLHGPHSAPR